MNLFVWLIWGGILGLSFGLFDPRGVLSTGDLVASIIGSLLGGLTVATFAPTIPITETKPGKFSIGALVAAIFASIIFILTFRFFS